LVMGRKTLLYKLHTSRVAKARVVKENNKQREEVASILNNIIAELLGCCAEENYFVIPEEDALVEVLVEVLPSVGW
jgi:hypothetical protein